jgi:hypothetical protein
MSVACSFASATSLPSVDLAGAQARLRIGRVPGEDDPASRCLPHDCAAIQGCMTLRAPDREDLRIFRVAMRATPICQI